MSRFFKTTIFAGVPFGLLMGLFFALRYGGAFGCAGGLAGGVLFGLTMASFVAWQSSRFSRQAPALEGERIRKQGPANHFRGWEGVGGWLYLTDKRLLFRSHGFNVQRHELSMPLAEVADVQACSTAWVIPNGLRLVTEKGAERFVVEGRRDWVDQIRLARG
jgi:hypothetical protein